MNVTVTLEQRFDRTPDGAVWTQVAFAYSFWLRYLAVFDAVRILARVRDVPEVPPDSKQVDGDRVSVTALPYYLGPSQYWTQRNQFRRVVAEAFQTPAAVILRVPSQIATVSIPRLNAARQPFGLEVVGDPHDVFAPGAMQHPLRPFFRHWFTWHQKRQCANADAVAYVTSNALQCRYPAKPDTYTTHYSSIELSDEAFAAAPRTFNGEQPATLITVGTLAQLYKGTDTLIDAVGICNQAGTSLRLRIVGDGKYRAQLESKVRAAGLESNIVFKGQMPAGEAVRQQLDSADLFILPSRQEGLPRAMIEAMARGLPCIGSTVGGIPELLPEEDMVAPDDAKALAEKIQAIVHSPDRMAHMSARNLEVARTYHESILRERRTAFYRHLRDKTQHWMDQQ